MTDLAIRNSLRRRVCTLPIAGLLLFLLSACSTVPFAPTELTPVPSKTAAELSGSVWSSGSGSLLIRQSALFELKSLRFPMTGIMKLDRSAGSARLVGMNDMGVKFYDITVDRKTSRTNFVVPELAKYPAFAEAVAVSVRRIFLDPVPSPDDPLKLTRTSYQLTRKSGDATVSFLFGGAQARLLEKSCRGSSCSWRVRYYQYREEHDLPYPGGIVLEDDRAGYRLTLWIESVEKTDE